MNDESQSANALIKFDPAEVGSKVDRAVRRYIAAVFCRRVPNPGSSSNLTVKPAAEIKELDANSVSSSLPVSVGNNPELGVSAQRPQLQNSNVGSVVHPSYGVT